MKINNKLKKHFKEGIIAIAIAGITGLFAAANTHVEKYKETQAYYTESQCVVLTADEVNNIAFKEVATYLGNIAQTQVDDSNFIDSYIIYNNVTYRYISVDTSEIDYENNNSEAINFIITNQDTSLIGHYDDENGDLFNAEYPIYWYGNEIVKAFKESTITLTPTQLNDTTYSYLSEQIEDNYTNQLANSVIEYNGQIFTYEEYTDEGDYYQITWQIQNDQITYYTDSNVFLITDNENDSFIDSITIFNAKYIVDNINAPFETGDIIPAISGGLTIIGDLANEFMTGFSTLFWDSVGDKLTNFGIYSLTMLGVAITFAVIKLCLSVLRRDTGA